MTGRFVRVYPVVDQPMPVPQDKSKPNIAQLVANDHLERMRIGTERYGTPLQGFNGRDALIDAYQEALDLCQYLRQKIWEEEQGVVLEDLGTSYNEEQRRELLSFVQGLVNDDDGLSPELDEARRLVKKYEGLPF